MEVLELVGLRGWRHDWVLVSHRVNTCVAASYLNFHIILMCENNRLLLFSKIINSLLLF